MKNEESFSANIFRPEDAPVVANLFRAVYGEDYPVKIFYNEAELIAANNDGRYYTVIMRNSDGAPVGVVNLIQYAPFKGLYECSSGLVLKEFRSQGVTTIGFRFLYDEFIPVRKNIEEIFGEPVCNHIYMQKQQGVFNFIETGIEPALMPAEAFAHENSSKGRVAVMDSFRCYVPKPHRVFIPEAYENFMRLIYFRLDDRRDIEISTEKIPHDKANRAETFTFDSARVSRLTVNEAGGDFESVVSGFEVQARAKNVVVFQVLLNLGEPWVGEAVEILRSLGYFFCSVLPRWFDKDGMLMEKLECPPDFDEIKLHSEFSRELLDFIRKDWERAQACHIVYPWIKHAPLI